MIEDLDIEDGDEEGDRLYLQGVAMMMEEWDSEADEAAYCDSTIITGNCSTPSE
jgi:hypothetical protein